MSAGPWWRGLVGAVAAVVVTVAVGASAVSPADASPTRPRAMLDLPVVGPMLRGFEAPAAPYGRGHRGVKIQVAAGAAVRAAGTGIVHHAGDVAGVGWISIDHGDGRLTSYGPVQPRIRQGQLVVAGEQIGSVDGSTAPGAPGRVALHWGLRAAGAYVDPLDHVLGPRPSLVGPGDLALVVDAAGRYPD